MKLSHPSGTGRTAFKRSKNGKEEEYINNLWLAVQDLYTDLYVDADATHKEIRKYILEEVKWNIDKMKEDIEDPESPIYVD